MIDPLDSQLRDQLRAELRGDEAHAPDFDLLWDAAAARHRQQRRHVMFYKISALAAAIVCGGFLTLVLQPAAVVEEAEVAHAEVPWRNTVLLSDWQSPTDSLLPMTDDFAFNLNLTRP